MINSWDSTDCDPIADIITAKKTIETNTGYKPSCGGAKMSYKIIHSSEMGSIKLSLDVRLDEKKSEAILTKIANELRKNQIKKYKRIFICYYLPDMIVNAGAWATTHFDPNLEIKILGCQGTGK